MVYTEIKEKNGRKYYYRVLSVRKGNKVNKKRIYLGKDLPKEELAIKEMEANNKLGPKEKLKALNKLIPKIIEILKKNNVKKAGVFGSYARGEEKKDSDIDILIEYPKGIGFGFAGIEIQLTKALKKKIDLVSYNGLSPYLKDNILNQEIRII